MLDDDDIPKKLKSLRSLDPLSLAELESYIAEMEAEIARVRTEISKKQSHAEAAVALFRLPERFD